MKHSHLVSVVLLIFGLWGSIKVHAMVCYIGNEPDASGTMKLVLPYSDPCKCTEIRLGSVNAQPPPPRPFAPTYFDSAFGKNSLNAVISLLNCTKEKQECVTFETFEYQYHYKFEPLPKSPDGQVFVKFSVRADSDAHISLVGQNNDLPDMYEIVIGAWNDTGCAIRRQKQASAQVSVDDSDGWLDGQTYKHFWVSATPGIGQDGVETMTIWVGRRYDKEPFMEYIDHSPLDVKYLGFSALDGINGSFRFCGLDVNR